MHFQPDAFSLLFTNGITMLVAAGVLLIARLGLGSAAGGVRTWIAADLLMFLGRLLVLGELLRGDWPVFGLGPRVLSGTCLLLSMLWHCVALERLGGRRGSRAAVALHSAAFALVFGLVCALLPSGNARHLWMMVTIVGLSVRFLIVLRPMVAASWGARIMFGMMAGVVLKCSGLFLAGAVGLVDADQATPEMVTGVLFVDLLIALVMTFSFLLCLQERVRQRIEDLMVTDALTGSLNRHGLIPALQRDLQLSQRHGLPLSVALFDLDHFKRINDVHGHAGGDAVLKAFAATVRGQIRKTDLFGRWGGEEFLLVLPHTPLPQAHALCERIRSRLAEAPLVPGQQGVTVSAGVAQAGAADASLDVQSLVNRADACLYRAKVGRNRVVDS